MVLLNYRLNDQGLLDPEPCPCGRSLPRLRGLQGRITDVIPLPDGRELFAVLLEARLIAELGATIQNQLVVSTPGIVLWRIVPISGADRESLSHDLRVKSEAFLGAGMQVQVECVSEIPRTAAGKVQRVVVGESTLRATWRNAT